MDLMVVWEVFHGGEGASEPRNVYLILRICMLSTRFPGG